MQKILTAILNFSLDILFPQTCLFCGKEGEALCKDCENGVTANIFWNCPECGKRMPDGKIHDYCRSQTHISRFFSATPYHDEKIRRLIHGFKYNGEKNLAQPLAEILINFLERNGFAKLLDGKDILIAPIPLHKARLKDRGFNQSEEIAKIVAEYYKIPLRADILSRITNTERQTLIKETNAREQNVKNAFFCDNHSAIKGKTIIILDDVYTSGATMRECAIILKNAGAKTIWGMSVAKG